MANRHSGQASFQTRSEPQKTTIDRVRTSHIVEVLDSSKGAMSSSTEQCAVAMLQVVLKEFVDELKVGFSPIHPVQRLDKNKGNG